MPCSLNQAVSFEGYQIVLISPHTRYVSDFGYNGYKACCQHKALQSEGIDPRHHRIYPPCALEWKAARKRANMALEARMPDGEI